VTNKSQSVINRKRLDQRVDALEEQTLTLFARLAWDRDQDRHDFERLVEIMAGLDRVDDLSFDLSEAKKARDNYASRIAAASIVVPPPEKPVARWIRWLKGDR